MTVTAILLFGFLIDYQNSILCPTEAMSDVDKHISMLLPLQGVIVERHNIPRVSLRSALGSALVALSGRRILWGHPNSTV